MSEPEASPDQAETLTCPNCGAAVEFLRDHATAKCRYCGQSVPVPAELRVQAAPAALRFQTPETVTVQFGEAAPTRKGSRLGCTLLIGFVVFMVLVTVVLPLVLTANITSSIPKIPDVPAAVKELATTAAEIKAEPTRRPPTLTPTPAFAGVALQFGEKGMGPGQFTNAHLSGLDSQGHLYVGEYTGGRIQEFDTTGKFINQFFVGDKQTDLLGFAVNRNGVVYVSDGGDITRWDGKTGKALGSIKYDGGPGFGELALAPDGSLYAMWYQRRNGVFTSLEGAREDLVHFDANGKVIKVLPGVISSQTDNLELDNTLAVDGRGNVYVAAAFENAIFKFDNRGKFITRLGSSGEGASQFSDLSAIAVDGQGRIYVVESGDISVLKPDGSRLDKIKVDGAARQLLFDDAGALWVTTDDGVVKYQINPK